MQYTEMTTLTWLTVLSDAVQHNIPSLKDPRHTLLQAKAVLNTIWSRFCKIHSNFHEAFELEAFDCS